MNVLLVAQNYHPFVGGVEVHARQVAHELVRRGHGCRVAAVNFAASSLPRRLGVLHTSLLAPPHGDFDDGGVPVASLAPRGLDRLGLLPVAVRATPVLQRYAYHGLHRFGYPAYRAVYRRRMRDLVRGVDVVHALACGYLGWAAREAAERAGVPFVCTPFVHPGQWNDGPDDVAHYCRADAVVGLVGSDKRYLASLGIPAEKLRVIGVSPELPRATDGDAFRRRHGLGTDPVVLYVGRMMAAKGAPAVLAAAGQVWARVPQARFVFVGPGSVAEVALFAGTDSRIQYLGKVSLQEKADAMAACDVMCLPSISEILPTVYLEAWSLGKPVVGGMAHGLPELVEGNGAGLCASQRPDELAGTIVRMLLDDDLRARCGGSGRRMVEELYSVPAVTDQLTALYAEVAGGPPPSERLTSDPTAVRDQAAAGVGTSIGGG